MSTEIGDRIAQIRGQMSQARFAAEVGVHKNTLGGYERGERVPDATFLQKLHTAGYNANWILTGEGPERLGSAPTIAGIEDDRGTYGDFFALIPQYDVRVGAGAGGASDQQETEISRLAFRRDWLQQRGLDPSSLAAVQIAGDSMAPTIREGSIVLVDTRQGKVGDDGIYVIIHDGHIVAKRLQKDFRGGIVIRSDNPAYREHHLSSDEADQLHIIGRVVWAGGEI